MRKRLIVITCVILTLAICITMASCSNKKHSDTVVDNQANESQDIDDVQDDASADSNSDESNDSADNQNSNNDSNSNKDNGNKGYSHKIEKTTKKANKKQEEETKKTVDGNKVNFAQDEKSTTKKRVKPVSTTIPGDKSQKEDSEKESTKKEDSKKETTKKATTTTEPTTLYPPMTTTSNDGAIVLPDLPDDEYKLTPSLAMFVLQNKYNSEKYVVNCHEATDDSAKLGVYTLKDGVLYSTVKVNLKNGKAVEKIWETKETKNYILEF